jgi:polar amino acid transport system substrate-binding protein
VTGSETPVPHTGAPAPAALAQADIDAAKATLATSGQLTICTSLPYPPFEAQDASGNIVGFDVDFMNWMAKDMGVTTKIIDADFSGIQSGQAMQSKKCDIAAAGMTITPERAQSIEFSLPYYDASQTLMVLSSSSVTNISDLKGKKLGAQSGTTGEKYAKANSAQYGYTVISFDKISDEEQALQAGNIDAAIHDQPALVEYAKQQSGSVKIVQNFNTGEQYGFGAAKGNTALIKVANYVIQKAESDGTYQSSFVKWIGNQP